MSLISPRSVSICAFIPCTRSASVGRPQQRADTVVLYPVSLESHALKLRPHADAADLALHATLRVSLQKSRGRQSSQRAGLG
eukprot:4258493-Pleurochrysis_carterae.AAC.1